MKDRLTTAVHHSEEVSTRVEVRRVSVSALDRTVPQWRLRAVNGVLAGRTFLLYGTVVLGRGEHYGICFPEGTPGVSRRHCALTAVGGNVALWDLKSRYGTYVGGERLDADTPRCMKDGEMFSLGGENQLFRLEAVTENGIDDRERSFSILSGQGIEFHSGTAERLCIGRRPGNDVRITMQEVHVSGNHCVLFRENGQLYLRDLGSVNGTYLNGRRLKPHVSYRVVKGNSFYLAEEKYLFSILRV